MEGEIIKVMNLFIILTLCLFYSHSISSKLQTSKLRLLSLLPIFSLIAVFPLYFSSALLRSTVAFFITWLTTFKLLLFSFHSGPLFSDPPLPFPLFAAVAVFPTRLKLPTLTKTQDPIPKLPLNIPAKFAILALLIHTNNTNPLVPRFSIAKLAVNVGIIYFFLDAIMSISNSFVRRTFGVKVRPPFHEPYLSTSLQNYWGRRWNLLVSETLHDSVYKPIRYDVGSPRWAAVVAVFLVSGLMHEILYQYVVGKGMNPTWEITAFFVVHGICVAVEIEVKRMKLVKKWPLHWMVSGPITIAFLVITAHWLFFPPIFRIQYNNNNNN